MSEVPSCSAPGSAVPKAIGSLAKKQNDVTRLGTQKLKFTPTLPARRKKDEAQSVSFIDSGPLHLALALTPPKELVPSTLSGSSEATVTRDHGRGSGRGKTVGPSRGRGRGGAVPPPIEMVASGPFSMGPALAGTQASRHPAPRAAESMLANPSSATANAALGQNLTQTAAPTLLKSKGKEKTTKIKHEEEEGEAYSDPDEGVEIIDMNKIRDMDWMAPDALREEKKREKVKKKERESDVVDLKNAIDLSESEEEEEMEDLIEDFATKNDMEDVDPLPREDRLYFFQFPRYLPTFTHQKPESSPLTVEPPTAEPSAKKVSFAADTKPAATSDSSRPSTAPPESSQREEEHVDGIIGQLEVYKSGAVKIRLTNGALLEVNAATQPSFLQQAVHLDMASHQLTVLGQVNKQFVVSPDIDALLDTIARKAEDADKAMDIS